ncbi:MAG TPA: ABC transporter substrate-binding protein [Candidatus Binatia bacterium]|nr:ABC transporter substrate-binding protein [Candidatus Binatia bacterium]
MIRRIVVCLLPTVLLLTVSLVEAQEPKKVHRIGFLRAAAPPEPFIEAFREGLRQLDYVEGKSITIEYRWAEGKPDRLAEPAAELVRLKVEVIVAAGANAIQAAKNATSTVPIVMAASGDAVGSGLVASLARPGGNVTGLTLQSPELSGKRLELVKEVAPKLSLVAVLLKSGNPLHSVAWKETQAAAQALKVKLQSVQVRESDEFERAFAIMTRDRADALAVPLDPMFNDHRARITDLAAKNRLPAMYAERQYVDAGGLMAYGANAADTYRRAALYVDKILKGTKPADLPVEQPTKFELFINLKAAKQIGLTIPPNVLARADRVIR